MARGQDSIGKSVSVFINFFWKLYLCSIPVAAMSSFVKRAPAQRKARVFRKPASLSQEQKREVRTMVTKTIKQDTEYKQFSLSLGPTAVYDGTAGTHIANLTLVTQGAADNQRLGDELTLKWLRLHMFFYNNSSATANPYVFYRVMIVQYNNFDNSPTIDELLLTSTANGGSTYGTFSSRNIDYLNTYHVVYDKTFKTVYGVPNAANYGSNSSYAVELKVNVPLRFVKKKIQFLAAGTVPVNGLWLFVTTGQSTVASDPAFAYTSALGFTDS